MTHAPEPLCPFCLEDRPTQVSATTDRGRVVHHCDVCGRSWKDVRDVNGAEMEGGETGP